MPDWSYHTIFRPVLERLPARLARNIVLKAMGMLASAPGGGRLINFLGHARPAADDGFSAFGQRFPSRVGLGCLVDQQMVAIGALVRLGMGAVEIGPVHFGATPIAPETVERDSQAKRIRIRAAGTRLDSDAIVKQLEPVEALAVPVIVRLSVNTQPEDLESAAAQSVARRATAVVIPIVGRDAERGGWKSLAALLRSRFPSLLLLGAVAANVDNASRSMISAAVVARELDGLVIEPQSCDGDTLESSAADASPLLDFLHLWRAACGRESLLVARGGLYEPLQISAARRAGADLVLLDSGLVFAGPGLPKRATELLRAERAGDGSTSFGHFNGARRVATQSWIWLALLAWGLLGGGILVAVVAMTRVVLPYDEALTGLTRPQIAAINARLLDFMRHDRVSLSSAMLAVGILFSSLAMCGVRRGEHWAWLTVVVSAAVGYLSFFLFLGFGYFDPFHAFVTATSFPLLLLGIHAELPPTRRPATIDDRNDWRWRLSHWGQLLLIVHGCAVITAGVVIACIGTTSVFVREDIEFLCTEAGLIEAAHPRLLPLVAHDRASFGGMLISCGVATTLMALWGFRRGVLWVWQALIGAGALAYAIAIAIHWRVGYWSLVHLMPAYLGLGSLWIAAALSYPFLSDQRSCATTEQAS